MAAEMSFEMPFEEKMWRGFLNLVAQREIATIIPTTMLDPICRPNAIL
jgi:hypothetical protein